MDAVELNTTPPVRFTYSVDGIAADPSPDSATVTITRADGTVLHTNVATTNAGVGVFTYTLSAADTSLLDILTFEWHIGTQTFTTTVQVQGDFYFTISEALALPELAGKTASEIAKIRTLAEQAFEDAAGVAFVPRYHRVTLGAMRGPDLRLPKLPVRALRTVSETTSLGGTPADVVLSGLALTRSGIYRQAGWTAGPGNVVVGYEYGYDRPPERVARAVLLLAQEWLAHGPISNRATSIQNESGTVSLLMPGVRGTVFGIPEVDAALEQYGIKKAGVYSIPLTADSNSYYRNPDRAWWGSW